MKCASIVFATLAFVAGMTAAWYWFRASKIVPSPPWPWSGTDSDVKQVMLEGQVASNEIAAVESAKLNKLAAAWTGASVVLGTIGNLVGACSH
jgi:hypothetical protein